MKRKLLLVPSGIPQKRPSFTIVSAALGLLLLVSFFSTGCLDSLRTATKLNPEQQEAVQLYHEAWELVAKNYLDPTFNYQEWSRWEHRYDHVLRTKQDSYVAIHTMLISLNDPYSRLLPPKVAKEQDLLITSRLFGVGIHIAQDEGKTMVLGIVEDSPAAKAKLQVKDVVLSVDEKDISDLPIDEVVNLIRGEKGTKVNLTISRAGKTMTIPVTRDEIHIKSVEYKKVTPQIGYLILNSFISQEAMGEIEAALTKAKVDTNGLIIDLRGNSGGLLPNALDMADDLLGDHIIVSVVNRDKQRQDFKSDAALMYDRPLVVLIDGGSASASEIFAGAIQDNKRGILIGETSFGKGLVQRINSLPDGSEINLTIAKYLTPSGKDINKLGIKPDISVPYTLKDRDTKNDPALKKAISVLNHKI